MNKRSWGYTASVRPKAAGRPLGGVHKAIPAELEEADKAEDLRKMGERAAEGNETFLFGAKDAEHNNAPALVAFVREFGGAA